MGKDDRRARVASAPGHVSFEAKTANVDVTALDVLQHLFGHDSFRVDQPEIINATLEGRDVFAVVATAGGKSVTYQVPAVVDYFNRGQSRITVVVSPLIATMRDQVGKLNEKDVPVAFFDSLQKEDEKKEELKKLKEGRVALVYVSPERFCTSTFQNHLRDLPIARVVVDEVHLVSQWGHDFRFSLGKRLGQTIERIGRPPIFVCSATVTEPVRQDIFRVLGLRNNTYQHIAEIDRPNLEYQVRTFSTERDKMDRLVAEISDASWDSRSRSGNRLPWVVFCSARKTTENITDILKRKGIKAAYYHADVPAADRLAVQDAFMKDELDVIVATTAFGMGVDKANIRRVIHWHMPGSLEQYAQEAGRAGRDGQPSRCEIWYQAEDVYRQMFFVNGSNPSISYIMSQYNRLWKMLTPAQQRQQHPECIVNFPSFLGQASKAPSYFITMRQSALTALQEAGVIEIDGWRVIFMRKPEDLERDFPFKPEEIRRKRDLAILSLKVMTYYAHHSGDDTLRGIVMRHFRHNGVVDSVRAQDLWKIVDIDPARILTVLVEVNRSDYNVHQLSRALRGKASIKMAAETRGVFKDLADAQVQGIIEHASYLGYLRLHRRGRHGWVSLARGGIQLLQQNLADHTHDTLEPSNNFKALEKRIGHFAEKATLHDALKPWYDTYRDKATLRTEEQCVRALLALGTRTFRVLDRDITGRELAAKFWKRPDLNRVTVRELRLLANYLFPDLIDRLADAKRLKLTQDT